MYKFYLTFQYQNNIIKNAINYKTWVSIRRITYLKFQVKNDRYSMFQFTKKYMTTTLTNNIK